MEQLNLPVVVTASDVVLTPRERQTMKLVAEGYSNKIIGDKMNVSTHTAKFHINNLMKKFKAHNRANIAALAVRLGIA